MWGVWQIIFHFFSCSMGLSLSFASCGKIHSMTFFPPPTRPWFLKNQLRRRLQNNRAFRHFWWPGYRNATANVFSQILCDSGMTDSILLWYNKNSDLIYKRGVLNRVLWVVGHLAILLVGSARHASPYVLGYQAGLKNLLIAVFCLIQPLLFCWQRRERPELTNFWKYSQAKMPFIDYNPLSGPSMFRVHCITQQHFFSWFLHHQRELPW